MDLSYEQAVERILAQVPRHTDETVELFEAQGRVLTESVQAIVDLPPFDNSSMDGYAVRARDVATASPSSPVRLQVSGKVAAGGNYLGSTASLLSEGCLGQIPEILDGDAPHAERGCDAQAWGATEALRAWNILYGPQLRTGP